MRALAAGAVALLVVGCQTPPPPEMTQTEKEATAQEVLHAAHAVWARGVANDFEGMMASWTPDPAAYFVGDPVTLVDRLTLLTDLDAVRTYWEPNIQERSGTNMIPTEEHVAVLSQDAAVYVCKGDWNVLDLEGNVGSHGLFAATTVFVKENGEWKQLHYHQSWDTVQPEDSTGG